MLLTRFGIDVSLIAQAAETAGCLGGRSAMRLIDRDRAPAVQVNDSAYRREMAFSGNLHLFIETMSFDAAPGRVSRIIRAGGDEISSSMINSLHWLR